MTNNKVGPRPKNLPPTWVEQRADDWAHADGMPVQQTLIGADPRMVVAWYLLGWRRRMGLSERTLGARPMNTAVAAAWVDTPVRTWESWEQGRRMPPACLWGRLRQLLRDARAGKLQTEDEPSGVNPGVAWRGVKPTETLEDTE